MKRLIQLLLLCLFCGLGLLAQEKQAQEPRLLGIPLGLTKTEFEKRLKAIAPRAIYRKLQGDYINTPSVYGIKTSGIEVEYVRNKTAHYAVVFKRETSADRLLSSYSELKNLLTQKYGEPDEVSDSKYHWIVGKTKIELKLLHAPDGADIFFLMYNDRELVALEDPHRLLGIPLGITKAEFEKQLKAIAPRAIYSEQQEAYINTPSVLGIKTSGIEVEYGRNKTDRYTVIFEKETSEDMLLSRYSELKNLLTQKYGEPDGEIEKYDSEYLYNESDAEKSRAIARGSGRVGTAWIIGKNAIHLRGRNRIIMKYGYSAVYWHFGGGLELHLREGTY